MELRHLRSFVAAAEEEHFGRAARRLRIAQPALSRQIADLERELGCDLFQRVARGVRLNAAGVALLEGARETLATAEEASDRARRAAAGASGRLAIAFDPAAAWNGVVPDTISTFRRNNAEVELVLGPLDSSAQADALAAGRIDAGFHYDLPAGAKDISAIRVAVHGAMLALPPGHGSARLPAIALNGLADETFIVLPRRIAPRTYGKIFAAFDRAGIAPRIVEAPTEAALLGLVACGAGVALVNAETRWRKPDNVTLAALADSAFSLPLYFAWRPDNRAPALDAFRTVAIKHSRPAEVTRPL